VSRYEFSQEDPVATYQAQERARSLALSVYQQDPVALSQLRGALEIALDKLMAAESLSALGLAAWKRFEPLPATGADEPTDVERQELFVRFREALREAGNLEDIAAAVADALAPFEERGLLEKLPDKHVGNKKTILVRTQGERDGSGRFDRIEEVPIADVLIATASPTIQKNLTARLKPSEVAERIFAWLQPVLPSTLTLDLEETRRAQQAAESRVGPQMKVFPAGSRLAMGGQPLDATALHFLALEHAEANAQKGLGERLARSLAALGMYVGIYTICGFYALRHQPKLIESLPRLTTMLCLALLTVTMSLIMAQDAWRAELIPLLLFGMTVAMAYDQELAILFCATVALAVTVATGLGLAGALVLTATCSGAILALRRIRTRSRLLLVGLFAAAVAFLTTLGAGTLAGQRVFPELLLDASKFALWAILAGSLMTCLLPLIERWFGVLTELSLIELGDPAHPLLQELVRRAPGTYNHSITVASLAEAAADAIGARGLLVRVGAYYHDIGKMLKPGYYIENQGQAGNRHESLVPAMSTLVIIAHVKDGANLGRQHRLPEPIIDFIQQHHGTTLVEYFYRQANKQHEANPIGNGVDESSFRYPGPKPQSKEAGVLMLADAVESASRVLVEPTPSRIESLVREITMKRLMDGQFDECGLTLMEVQTVAESLAKSLTAVYHGRVKYPDQRSA
jgi:putative nucleotidyltransferase with HDIG domain